jgi:four helix bundle protein
MMRINSVRELDDYRLAFSAAMEIFEISKTFPREERYSLTDQIRRSSRSMRSNLAEGWRKRRYKAVFVNKLSDASQEALETQTWLEFALACGYIDQDLFKKPDEKYEHIFAMLATMEKKTESFCAGVSSVVRRPSSILSSLVSRLSSLVIGVLVLMTLSIGTAFANNLVVKKVQLIGQNAAKLVAGDNTATIQFDLSQENSWRLSPQLYDAAWVFVKYSVNDGPWLHATLNAADTSAIAGTSLAATLPPDRKGVFLYRSGESSGTLNTTGIKFTWNITADLVNPDPLVTTKITLKVFALEMVHIPRRGFYAGDGTTTNVTGQFCAYNGVTNPFYILSEDELTLGGGGAGSLANNNSSGMETPDDFSNTTPKKLPAAFPKGYQAFYIMKYELTQGQYRDFLNTLTRAQQATRVETTPIGSGTTSVTNRYVMSGTSTLQYRNGIRCDAMVPTSKPILFYCDLNGNGISNEPADGEFIAANYMSSADLAAYADWAGLRPFTELEFEKAARGPANPVANEYAWGTAGITASALGPANPGANNELAANGANCLYSGGVSGPMRAGFAATSNSLRYNAGASFYGVMELSGNLWERSITVGDATSRLFTGLHGDGVLDASGNANVSNWTTSGFRGGAWNNNLSSARASDRVSAGGKLASRGSGQGGRFARTE